MASTSFSKTAVADKYYNNTTMLLEHKMSVGKRVIMLLLIFFVALMPVSSSTSEKQESEPKPKAWPEQFHSLIVMNNSKTNTMQVIDLWYDWPNGRNLNLIRNQLGKLLYDVEWTNGTSYYYTLHPDVPECRTLHFEVGILSPSWLEGATYLGQRYIDGFLCNVWTKVDFIWYYEDVVTQRPVYWMFYTGMESHVMTFELGAVLEDSKWQAPIYCFNDETAIEKMVQHPLAAPVQRPSLSLVNM
ncbi:hypothetical protein BVRB_3g068970 [Beta vulgaris subsp. vulgaris]|nr:hypothetical protein BVRB_3g068970 [Beta vulgaris subsp. vulgaris]